MLPGNLCIGILEEDNPLKSYFRLKPLLVEEEGKYVPFTGADRLPEDGCIRIVPDKNESSHFKARMRRMGRYCVLDLRDHAGENDKIRPNKNYRGDDVERNANIVYSDVVREPAENMIFEILPQGGEWDGKAPATPRVLRGEATNIYIYSEDPEPELAPDGENLNETELQRFEIAGFSGETLRFAIRMPKFMPSVVAPLPLRQEFAPPMPAPVPEVSRSGMQEAESKPAPQPEKPWISHDLPPVPPMRSERMSPLQQALAAQSGLNPKRSRSLQEIIEEKWRHSRVDQLGHPVPANAMGQPVENPLERALEALRGAWRIPEIHDRLVDAIAEMQEFAGRLEGRRREIKDSALRHELEDLEAERLKTLSEIEKLRRDKAVLRETFKQEIRAEEDEALQAAIAKTRAAQNEQKKQETAAQEARKAAEFAQDAFNSLNDGRFEEKLREFALTSRAVELLRRPADAQPDVPKVHPSDEAPDRREWIDRVRRAFRAEGLEINEIDAANLLVCVALNNSLLLSGKASSDKCAVGRALARALGAVDSGCYAEISVPARHGAKADLPASDAALPTVVLIRNANHAPGADVTGGMLDAQQDHIVISALSDGGFPVPAEALERSFLIRLEPVSAQTPWRSAVQAAEEFLPVRFQTLQEAFLNARAELPPALERRLQNLRDALALHDVRLSRHTLDQMWHFCAAMQSLGKISVGEALDLAFAQKALPCILAEAPVDCLIQLKDLLVGMPHSLALLDQPLPILV